MDKREEQLLVELLAKLEQGFLPYEIFKQIARLTVLPIIEFVPLRMNEGKIEVLLIERPKDDDIWPGELHTPGTVVRATDLGGDLHGAFDRILNDELERTKVSAPHFVGTLFHQGKRGAEHAQIYWVEVVDQLKTGKFYLTDNLPSNMMEQQRKFIQQAAKSFLANREKLQLS